MDCQTHNYHQLIQHFITYKITAKRQFQQKLKNIDDLKNSIPQIQKQISFMQESRKTKLNQLNDLQNTSKSKLTQIEQQKLIVLKHSLELASKIKQINIFKQKLNSNLQIIKQTQSAIQHFQNNKPQNIQRQKIQKLKIANQQCKFKIQKQKKLIQQCHIINTQIQVIQQLRKNKYDFIKYLEEIQAIRLNLHKNNQKNWIESTKYIQNKLSQQMPSFKQKINNSIKIIKNKIDNNVDIKDLKMLLKFADVAIEPQIPSQQQSRFMKIYQEIIQKEQFDLLDNQSKKLSQCETTPEKQVQENEKLNLQKILESKIYQITLQIQKIVQNENNKDQQIKILQKKHKDLIQKINSFN